MSELVSDIMWRPRARELEFNNLTKFTNHLGEKVGKNFSNFNELHKFTVENKKVFWSELIDFFGVIYQGEKHPELTDDSFNSYGWFPNVELNFAENLLSHGKDDAIAIKFFHESGARSDINYRTLKESTARFSTYLKTKIGAGDLVAAYMPNIPETIVSMLGVTSLGGIFTSTSPDFGIEGVVDRFGQSKPKILVASLSYSYNGKVISQVEKIREIKKQVPSIEEVIVVDFLSSGENHEFTSWEKALESFEEINYVQRKFNDPLYVMYSSGTTGKPKCMVHSIGGTLLQHIKEHGLHGNMASDKTTFFFTTCGWMMWNWLVSGIYFGGSIVLYEGSPGYPSLSDYLSIINKAEMFLRSLFVCLMTYI